MRVALVILLSAWSAAAAPAKIANIKGGVGYVTTTSGANGISAEVGRWDTAYPNFDTGTPAPGLERSGRDYGSYWESPSVSFARSLNQWRNQRISEKEPLGWTPENGLPIRRRYRRGRIPHRELRRDPERLDARVRASAGRAG